MVSDWARAARDFGENAIVAFFAGDEEAAYRWTIAAWAAAREVK